MELNSKQLFRTKIDLTGNYSIYVEDNSMYINSLVDSEYSADLKKLKISKNSNFAKDLSNYFNLLDNNIDNAFKINSHTYSKFTKKFSEQYDLREWSGAKKKENKISFFAPLWLGNDIPSKFVVYKIKGTKNPFRIENNFYENVIQNSTLVKSFDLSTRSGIGNYLNQHKNSTLFKNYCLEIANRESPELIVHGISLRRGGIIKHNAGSSIFKNRTTAREFNKNISDVWSQHGISCANLINLSFVVDDIENDEEFYRYYGFYVNEETSSIELQADPYQFYYYNKNQVLKSHDDSLNKINVLESPRYYLNNDSYDNTSTIDQSAGTSSTKNYLGFLKFKHNDYLNYIPIDNENSANLSNLDKTNLSSKKLLSLGNNIPLNKFFYDLEVKFDHSNDIIYSTSERFNKSMENSYIIVPNIGASNSYWLQPKIKEVLSTKKAIIDPRFKSLIKDYNQTFQIKVAKPFIFGFFNPIEYADFNLSMFFKQDYEFEPEHIQVNDINKIGIQENDFWGAQNIFDAAKEQDLVFSEDVHFPYLENKIQWRSIDGTNVKNNYIPLSNAYQLGNNQFSPSSNNLSTTITLDNNTSNHHRYTHEWCFIGPVPSNNYNFKIRLDNYIPETGKILNVENENDLIHDINKVKFIESGEELDTETRSTLIRISDDTNLSDQDIINYLNSNQSTTIGNNTINFNSTIIHTSYTQLQELNSYVYLNTLNSKITDITLFEDVNTDQFSSIFSYSDDEKLKISKNKSRYSTFNFGNIFQNSYCWHKGYKVNAIKRVDGYSQETSLKEARSSFTNEENFNEYKFATILVEDNTISEYKISVIRNEKFKFFIVVLSLPQTPSTLTEFYEDSKFTKYSFSWLKVRLGKYQESNNNTSRSDLKISMYSILENGTKVFDDFYLNIKEASNFKATKKYNLEHLPKSEWPRMFTKSVVRKYNNIGTRKVNSEDVSEYIQLPGNRFNPEFYSVLHFEKKEENKPKTFKETQQFGVIHDVQIRKYGNFENNLYIFNHRFQNNINLSGKFQGKTFKELYDSYEFRNDYLVDFPKIGEVSYDFINYNIFSSQWDNDIFVEYNKTSNLKRLQSNVQPKRPGYITVEELKNPFNFKSINLPQRFQISSPTQQLLLSSQDTNNNLLNDTNFPYIYAEVDFSKHFINFFTDRWLNKNLFDDIDLTKIKNVFANKESYIKEYIIENILKDIAIDNVRVFKYTTTNEGLIIKQPNFLDDNINFNLDVKHYENILFENSSEINFTLLNTEEKNKFIIKIQVENLVDSELLSRARLEEIEDMNFAVLPIFTFE